MSRKESRSPSHEAQGTGGIERGDLVSRSAGLAPDRGETAGQNSRRPAGRVVTNALSRFSLIVVLALLWVIFSLWNPGIFDTTSNMQTILLQNATIGLLALAVMVPLVANHFDLSAGFQYGLAQSLCAILVVQKGWNPLLSIAIVFAVGALLGVINGQLITRLEMPSFTTTLGTGLVILGITEAVTQNQVVTGSAPQGFLDLGRGMLLGIPLPFVYLALVALVLFVVLELTVWGRKAYAVGANPTASRVSGIATERLVRQSFIVTGVLCALAGCVSVTSLGGSSPVVGLGSLLPAFAGAFLGATCIRPGRYNVAGTVIAVYVIGVGISGLQQKGADAYAQDLFNGFALLIALIVSTLARRRRAAT